MFNTTCNRPLWLPFCSNTFQPPVMEAGSGCIFLWEDIGSNGGTIASSRAGYDTINQHLSLHD